MLKPAPRPGLAVVTGASSGVGAALARRLSLAGRPVLAVARRADRLAALAEEARAGASAPIHPLAVDVADPGAPDNIASAARDLGGAAWLVNNAGAGYFGHFEEQVPSRLASLIRVNCEAPVLITRALLPQLRTCAEGEGVVLNVASSAAFQPTPFSAVYGASKAFVLSFSEALAEELRGARIFVGAFCPGPVHTEFGEVAGAGTRYEWVPSVLTADDAAKEALAQIARRDVVYVPKPLYRLSSVAVRLLPRSLVRRISARAHLGETS